MQLKGNLYLILFQINLNSLDTDLVYPSFKVFRYLMILFFTQSLLERFDYRLLKVFSLTQLIYTWNIKSLVHFLGQEILKLVQSQTKSHIKVENKCFLPW